MTTEQTQFPPPALDQVFHLLAAQALAAMGLVPMPDGSTSEKNLPAALYFIGLLEQCDQRLRNTLSPQETHALGDLLHRARMAYLEVQKR